MINPILIVIFNCNFFSHSFNNSSFENYSPGYCAKCNFIIYNYIFNIFNIFSIFI